MHSAHTIASHNRSRERSYPEVLQLVDPSCVVVTRLQFRDIGHLQTNILKHYLTIILILLSKRIVLVTFHLQQQTPASVVMQANWLEQAGHGSQLARASGSWQPIGYSKWVMAAKWLEQVGHGS